MRKRIEILKMDLTGLTIITEAATGAYACTALIAAMAGARRVYALCRDTEDHGTAKEARDAVHAIATTEGVSDRIFFVNRLSSEALGQCDILTNSGHLRPISSGVIEQLSPHAVIALMFEAWEFRQADLDLSACRARGIRIAAVNESHPDIAVFPFLGPLCVRLIESGGEKTKSRNIALICDNPFEPFIARGLVDAGATVTTFSNLGAVSPNNWDIVLIALNPNRNAKLGAAAFSKLSKRTRGALVVQFWGDLDHDAAKLHGFTVAPTSQPASGHMGILLSELGFEPIVRLQTGSLRAAEMIARGLKLTTNGISSLM